MQARALNPGGVIMLKLTSGLGLAILAVGLAATVAPAAAASVASCRSDMVLGPNGKLVSSVDLRAESIAMALRQQGYDVDSVEDWGGCAKAYINDPGGKSHIQMFDPDTLAPLSK
jgi:hypothetical protein